jgi:succinate dehydrogenase / fumarate reductase membrane anchor subunit
MVSRWRLGGIHHGLNEWLLQRLTAVYIGLFGVVVIVYSFCSTGITFSRWQNWFNHPLIKIGLAVFVISLLVHGWTGMRSVFLDYAKPLWFRFLASAASTLFFLSMLVWSAMILF